MNKIYRNLGKRGRTTIPYEIRVKLNVVYDVVDSYKTLLEKVMK